MSSIQIPPTSKALAAPAKAAPLELISLPTPTPRANQVLIKVATAALNPHDSKIHQTGLLIPSFPFVPGADLGGTVVKLGPDVTKYAVGDEVFAQLNWDTADGGCVEDGAGLREFALVDVRCSAKVDGTGGSVDDAITMPTNAVAALWGFVDGTGFGLPLGSVFASTEVARKKDGFEAAKHDLLVVGGGSQVGKLIVQFARMMGFRRIVVVAGLKNEEDLKKMGATHVVDRKLGNADAITQIRDIVGDELQYAFNAASPDKTIAVGSLSDKIEGTVNSILYADVQDKALVGDKKYHDTFSMGQSMVNKEAAKWFWEKLPTWLRTGELTVPKWTVIKGLDAKKAQSVLDNYLGDITVAEHTHLHP